jgi:hypothetical protein
MSDEFNKKQPNTKLYPVLGIDARDFIGKIQLRVEQCHRATKLIPTGEIQSGLAYVT